jgi:hypothetical protein
MSQILGVSTIPLSQYFQGLYWLPVDGRLCGSLS